MIERGCGFAIKNSKGFTASDFSFTHGVQAAVEAFGREQFEVMTNARKLEARKKAREFRNRENYSSNNSGGGGENGLGLISNMNGNGNGTPIKTQGIGNGNEETGIENSINSEKGVETNLKDKDINSTQSSIISSSNNNSSKSPKSLRHHPSLPQLPSNKSNNHYLNSSPKISSSDSLFDGSIVHNSNKDINPSTNNNSVSGISQSGSTSTIASNSDLSSVANRMRMKDQMAMGEYLSKTLNTPSNSNGGLGSAIHSISSTPIKSKSPGIVQSQSGTTTPPPIPNSNEKSKFISSPLNQTSSTSRNQGSTTEGNQSTPNSPSNHQRSQSEGALNASYENQSLINQSPSKILKWKKSDLTNTPPPLPSK